MSMPLALAAILVFGVVPLDSQSVPSGKPGEAISNQALVFARPDWQTSVVELDGTRRSRNPYENLFAPAHQPPQLFVEPAGPLAVPEPIVKCTIIMVPADPGVDPGIVVRLPDDGVDFKIRRVRPEPCKP